MDLYHEEVLENIEIVLGDITTLKVDAVVNAANKWLECGGGVDRAIHKAAGYPELHKACKALGGCPTGQAKVTPGFNLPAKWIIHAVGPVYAGTGKNRVELASCYKNSLNIAYEKGLKSIAFPSISTGAFSYPKPEAAKVALETVASWLDNAKEEHGFSIKVIFCCYSQDMLDLYKETFAKLK